MDIKWYFTSTHPEDVWIDLKGPALRNSGCFKIKSGSKDHAIDYESTGGLVQPNGSWTCDVFATSGTCDLNEQPIMAAEVEVYYEQRGTAHVTWFICEHEFCRPAVKVEYK